MNNRVSVITKSLRTTRHLVSPDPKRSRRPIQFQRQTGHLSAHTVMTMMTSAIAQVAVPEAARPSTHHLIQHRAPHPER
jgi:hypothetical protein